MKSGLIKNNITFLTTKHNTGKRSKMVEGFGFGVNLQFLALTIFIFIRTSLLVLGKKRRDMLFPPEKIDIMMAKHLFLSRHCGIAIPINDKEFITFYKGHRIIIPYKDQFMFHEVRTVYLLPRKGETVIDVGAHYGLYSLLACKLVGEEGVIHAFEPSTRNYPALKRNLLCNRMKNVKLYRIALGNFNGEAKLYYGKQGARDDSLWPISDQFEIVRVDKLDNVIKKTSFKKVDLIKIDVEGTELDVLKGAITTIKNFKPKLTIASYHYEGETREILRYLKENIPSYRFKITIPNKNIPSYKILHAF